MLSGDLHFLVFASILLFVIFKLQLAFQLPRFFNGSHCLASVCFLLGCEYSIFCKHWSYVLTSIYAVLRTAILWNLTATLNLWFLIGATRTDIWTSTRSPTFITQGTMGLNLICGNYISRWHIDSVIVEAYCFKLLSSVWYKTTLSSPWKRLPLAKAVSCLDRSKSGINGIDREWGSLILYMKYRLLSSLDGFPLYVVGCHRPIARGLQP